MTERARIERLRDWFVLQLDFAEVFAAKSGIGLDAAITSYTNLCRRFGFARPVPGVPQSPEWAAFVRRVASLRCRAERIAVTLEFAFARLPHWPATVGAFGCFSFDPPKEGAVRIHFSPADKEGGIGPLSRQKCTRRVQELATMFAFIRTAHPDARYVQGGSWLYNIDAYRRLFPRAYVESAKAHTTPKDLSGGSWWGQFIDHDECVQAARVATFRERLEQLDPVAVWKVFPLPAMAARADIDVFYRHYARLRG